MSVQTVADRYEVERRLGGGGMAIVYLARDRELGRPVALKVLADTLADDAQIRQRFVREARLAARLSHPNVVRVYDAGEEGGRPYIVMECVDGESVAELLRREGAQAPDRVADLGVIGSIPLDEFSPDAAAAARWTETVLTDYSRSYLESLRPAAKLDGAELYHASPRDPVWDYVLSEPVARESLEITEAPVVMVGHSHVPLAMILENGRANGGLAPGGHEADLSRGRWLLNPGSVGQPRDNDARAAYLILDLDEHRASFIRVTYPVERTQAEIRERGLPETLAQRLALGL